MFRNAGVPPKQKITTFKISDNALIKPGLPLTGSRQRVVMLTSVESFSFCVCDMFRYPSLCRTFPTWSICGCHGQNVSSPLSV